MSIEKRVTKAKLKSQLNAKSVARRERHKGDVGVARAAAGARNDLLPHLEIVHRPTASLKNGVRRTRKSTPAQIERVIESINRFGLVAPLLIDSSDRLIAGHVVRDAAMALGISQVPCVVADHLSEDEGRLLSLALNRIGETGEWDIDLLRIEMIELGELGLDLSISGFTIPELDIILGDDAGTDAEEEVLEPDLEIEPVSKAGDLWLLGRHRLLCGDSLKAASYTQLMDGQLADAVFSDPPYNCKIEGFVGGLGKHKHADFAMAVGEMSDDAFTTFLKSYLAHCKAHISVGAVVFACMDWRQIDFLLLAGRLEELTRINMVVWNKGSGGMGSLYRSAYELIAVFCNGKSPATNNVDLGKHGRDRTNVWNYAGANRAGSSAAAALAGHPTPKPIELVADALLDVTKRGEIVLDPFVGSGTTIVAAEKTGRIAYGIELDPNYVDVAIRRWQKLTGEVAVQQESGLTFNDLQKAYQS